jgi:hypothetical protein
MEILCSIDDAILWKKLPFCELAVTSFYIISVIRQLLSNVCAFGLENCKKMVWMKPAGTEQETACYWHVILSLRLEHKCRLTVAQFILEPPLTSMHGYVIWITDSVGTQTTRAYEARNSYNIFRPHYRVFMFYIAHCLMYILVLRRFGSCICFRNQVKKGKEFYFVGPVRDSLSNSTSDQDKLCLTGATWWRKQIKLPKRRIT